MFVGLRARGVPAEGDGVRVSPTLPRRARSRRAPRQAPAARPSDAPPPDAGFTLVEVVVAATLLVVGVLATLALLDNGARVTSTSMARDTANSIAHEVTERAAGMRYTVNMNDLTDVRSGQLATPADRLRAAMDPTPPGGTRQSTDPTVAGNATPIAGAPEPWRTAAQWDLRRGATTYTVTYQACTRSEPVNGVLLMGPMDCSRPASGGPTTPPTPSAACTLSVLNAADVRDRLAAGADPGAITVRVQLLNLLGVEVCVKGTLEALNLGPLLAPLCQTLGDGTHALDTATGLLDSVVGVVGSRLALSVCPRADGTAPDDELPRGIATSTEVRATVSWREPGGGRAAKIVQSTVVRRGTS